MRIPILLLSTLFLLVGGCAGDSGPAGPAGPGQEGALAGGAPTVSVPSEGETPPRGSRTLLPRWTRIEPGTFLMGSPPEEPGRFDDETQHQVTLTRGFELTRTEITAAGYAELAQWACEQGYATANSSYLLDGLDENARVLLDMRGDCPVVYQEGKLRARPGQAMTPVREVSWYGAAAYCDWLNLRFGLPLSYERRYWRVTAESPYDLEGFRLPTEAEWEYACRAGSQKALYSGPVSAMGCSPWTRTWIGWAGTAGTAPRCPIPWAGRSPTPGASTTCTATSPSGATTSRVPTEAMPWIRWERWDSCR